jgi:hypothetical protein
MSNSPRRRVILIVLLAALLCLLALLWVRCSRPRVAADNANSTPSPTGASRAVAGSSAPAATSPDEVLTAATVDVPAQIQAGAVFSVRWTGPNNPDDYITIVRRDAPEGSYANHTMTREGNPLKLTAPIEAGEWEVRYMATRARTTLGRAPITVLANEATLDAPAEVVLGSTLSVRWTGPANSGDYITLVTKETPDGRYGNFTDTNKGSPLKITAPVDVGDAELRYMTGQGARVLARRAITITLPEVSLSAPVEVVAGATIEVNWKGPDNRGDYVTIVAKGTRDGLYGNYTDTAKGSPLLLLVPIEPGDAELRYMTGQGAKVLARRPLKIVAAEITLLAPAEVAPGAAVSVTWTGPNHRGDYITLVTKDTPDGRYASYADTVKGSPLTLTAPAQPGAAELRYMSGQGAKVLSRRSINVSAKTE